MRAQPFSDIVVYPTQAILRPPWTLFRGGPDWPAFWLRSAARTCRYRLPIPLDLPPRRDPVPAGSVMPDGYWCGPVTHHFGHAIAGFGGRIAWSAAAGTAPLVFSVRAGEALPPFFEPMLARLGIGADRIVLIDRPTLFRRLSVFPQSERLFGPAPSTAYLNLLDRFSGPRPPSDGGAVFVSRVGLIRGRFAGEAYLEEQFTAAGFTVFRPECHSLDVQLDTYRRADLLVFSEGSAIHALQLLGRVPGRVVIVARRKGRRFAEEAVRARASRVDYVDAVSGFITGYGRAGTKQASAGLAIIDDNRLVTGLERAGVPTLTGWDRHAFIRSQTADLASWWHSHHARREDASHPARNRASRQPNMNQDLENRILKYVFSKLAT